MDESTGSKRFSYGWVIVSGGFATHVIVAPTYVLGLGLFFNPIRAELGWGAGVTALAFSLRSFQSGILAPFVGGFIDRLGARKMMMAGMLILGSEFIILSRVQSLWEFYLAFLFIAFGSSIGYGQAMNAALVNWFRRQRVRALGLMWAGSSVGGFLVPVTAYLVSEYGWREALLICGLVIWFVGIPVASLMRPRPEPYGWGPDGDPVTVSSAAADPEVKETGADGWTIRSAAKTRSFWIIAVAQGATQLATGMVLTVHLIPFLEDQGMARATAATIFTVFSASSLSAKLALGWVGDRVEKRLLLCVVYGMQGCAIIVLSLSHGYWQAVPYAVLAGIGRGAQLITDAALISERFGTSHFAAIAGVLQSLGITAGIVGPFIGGIAYDSMGTYRPAFMAVGFVALAASPLILTLPKSSARPPEPVPVT